MLSARDKAGIVHECCRHQYTYGATFCSVCGQRLEGRGGYTVKEEYEEGARENYEA